jgi:hypothetical protein
VGDVIQYDSNGDDSIDALAFIHGRTDSQTYTVKDKDGNTPTAVAGDNDWAIYRAYTSLNNWETQNENLNITYSPSTDVNPSTDLVTADTVMMVACYGDGEDTTAVSIDGWTTDSDNTIKIYTPTSTSEVGTSQRHSGYVAASPSYYRIRVAIPIPTDEVIEVKEFVTIEGLVVRLDNTSTSDEGIRIDADNIEVTIKDCIIWTSQDISNQDGIYGYHQTGYTVNIENTIIYGFYRAGIHCQIFQDMGGVTSTWNINSTTIWDCGDEADSEAGGIVVRTQVAGDTVNMNVFNTIVADCSTGNDDYVEVGALGTKNWDIHNSIDSDNTLDNVDSGHYNCLQGRTATDSDTPGAGTWVVFEDITTSPYDLRLKSNAENDAQDAHTDSSGAGLSMPATDITGTSRPYNTNYDIGAYEYPSTSNTAPNTPTIDNYNTGAWTVDNTPTLNFTQDDPDSGEQVKYQIQIDGTDNTFTNLVVDYTSDYMAEGAASFTVGQAAGSGSYATGSQGQTLSDGSYYWRVKSIDDDTAESGWATANSGSIAFKVDATFQLHYAEFRSPEHRGQF